MKFFFFLNTLIFEKNKWKNKIFILFYYLSLEKYLILTFKRKKNGKTKFFILFYYLSLEKYLILTYKRKNFIKKMKKMIFISNNN
jgi:hypothetical protein